MLPTASATTAAALPLPEFYRRVERHTPPFGWPILAEPQAVLEVTMNRHAVRQPAPIAGSPWDTRTRPSRRRQAAPHESSTGPEAWTHLGVAAARILEELDEVVRKSHRPSALQSMLHRLGRASAKLYSRMAPEPPPPQSDLPPEIWFPWFFL